MGTAALIIGLLASETVTEAGIIRVIVDGIDPQQGRLVVFLFQEPAGVPPSAGLIFAGSSESCGDSTVTVPFLGVPHGTYALLAFQDTDGNGVPAVDPSSGAVEPFCYSRSEPASPARIEEDVSEFQRVSFLHGRDETVVELFLSPAGSGGTGLPGGAGRPDGPGGPGGPGGGERPR
jgi:uncharacterized protein (DUF2141 family)